MWISTFCHSCEACAASTVRFRLILIKTSVFLFRCHQGWVAMATGKSHNAVLCSLVLRVTL